MSLTESIVSCAAAVKWIENPLAKRIERTSLLSWLDSLVAEIHYPGSALAGQDLTRKMKEALLPLDYIDAAHEDRRRYRQEMLSPHYLDVSDRELTIAEVNAELEHLRACLDMKQIDEGLPFYKSCIDRINELRGTLNTKAEPPLFFLYGCMHDVTDRCSHRYRRLSV